MGTSPETVMTDKLGRGSGPRRKYSVAESGRWLRKPVSRELRFLRLRNVMGLTPTYSRFGDDWTGKAR